MKKLIAHPLTWIFYWLGDLVYMTELFPYSVYSTLFGWSAYLQEWAGLNSPWKNLKEE